MADVFSPIMRSPSRCLHRSVLRLGGSLTDHDISGDVTLRLVARALPRLAQRTSGPQTGHEFTLEGTAPLDVDLLVDRLMADTHLRIAAEIDAQPFGDLLGAPGCRPPPVGAVRLVQPLPGRLRPIATVPSERCSCPLSRVCTYLCSRGLVASLAGLARRASLRPSSTVTTTSRQPLARQCRAST